MALWNMTITTPAKTLRFKEFSRRKLATAMECVKLTMATIDAPILEAKLELISTAGEAGPAIAQTTRTFKNGKWSRPISWLEAV